MTKMSRINDLNEPGTTPVQYQTLLIWMDLGLATLTEELFDVFRLPPSPSRPFSYSNWGTPM